MMGLGLVVPTQFENLLREGHHPMTLPLALTDDGFKCLLFLGIAPLLIGLLRNRKRKKEGPRA
jgi:hypothetical protein